MLFFRRFCWSKPRCKVTNFISNCQIFCVKNLLRTSLFFVGSVGQNRGAKLITLFLTTKFFCVKNLLSISSHRRFKERSFRFAGAKVGTFFSIFQIFLYLFLKFFYFDWLLVRYKGEKNKRFYGVLRCFRRFATIMGGFGLRLYREKRIFLRG